MLDFANALQDAIRGRLGEARTMPEVNLALRGLFECFHIEEVPGDGAFSGILIQPWLPNAVMPSSDPETGWPWPALVKPDEEAPPLR
jgi:hypothetical protein